MPKNIDDLGAYFDSSVINVLKNSGYCDIWDGQWECIQKSLIEQKNALICLPTGSGKTFPALLAIINATLNKRGKAVYIVPLRALAKQKYDEFKKVMSPLGIKVGISTGDYAKDEYSNIGAKDVVITTIEKMDSFIRHNEDWLYDVTLFVIDEIQMVDDPSRGLTLEIVTSEILRRFPTAQRIAISAVIGNPEEFKNWLGGELIFNEERIIPLQMGVFTYDGMLRFRKNETNIQLRNNLYKFGVPQKDSEKKSRYSNTIDLTKYLVNQKKQCIIFATTREYAEKLAVSLADDVEKGEYLINSSECEKLAYDLQNSIEEETSFSKQLIKCSNMGVCFHHAGLHLIQRNIIEKAFEDNILKVIVSTPTLEQGINLPAGVVIIADVLRWDQHNGSFEFLPRNSVLNMMGRAGRPGYHTLGEAILIEDKKLNGQLRGKYIEKKPERVLSQLHIKDIRRKHLNGLVASNRVTPVANILDYLRTTLWFTIYEYIFEDVSLQETILGDLSYLEENGFVKRSNSYYVPTTFGKIVSDSCISCETGLLFQKAALKMKTNIEKWRSINPWPIFQLLLLSSEINTYRPYDNDFRGFEIASKFESNGLLLSEIPKNGSSEELSVYSRRSLLASLFCKWIEEKPLSEIIKCCQELRDADFEVGELLEWLGDAFVKIAIYSDVPKGVTDEVLIYCDRAVYGVKEELLEFTKIEGVRRRSARKLFEASISYTSLKEADQRTLLKLVGPFVVGKIKSHFEQIELEGENPVYDEENVYTETEEVFEEGTQINNLVETLKQNDNIFEFNLKDAMLKSRFFKIKHHCESNLSYVHSDSCYFRFFTNHTGIHSNNVFNLIIKILDGWVLQKGEKKLNEYEYFLLAVCSWCHDLGMLKKGEENFEDIRVVEKARKEHAKRITSYLDVHFHQVGLLDDAEKVLVSKICSHHSSSENLDNLREIDTRLLNEEPIEVRTKLLASLLRLADSLDADKSRLPRKENRDHPEISSFTKREYRKHEIVQEVKINSSRKTIFIQVIVNNNNPNDQAIYEEVKSKLYEEFNSVKPTLLKYGINIENLDFLMIDAQ